MIKKACLVLCSSLLVTLLAVGCTSSDEDTNTKTALSTNTDSVKITLDQSRIKTVNGVDLSNEEVSKTTAQENPLANKAKEEAYDPSRQYGSIWKSELFRNEGFKLNIKLTPSEQKEAKILARSFESHMERSKMFMHYLLTQLHERNLPIELAAIPLVESGFNPRAKSYANAHGPWQFTRPTGKSFGLVVNAKYDEFYDFVASTDASLNYLEHLYKALDKNWELALIAYNQGEFGVKKSIRRARAAGVKDINPNTISLTKTARTYLKRVRAYADILKNPAAYGLEHPYIENRPAFKRVAIGGRVSSMKEAAKLAGVDLKTLQHLNAGFLTDSLKTDKQRGLLVPIENAHQLERAIGIEPNLKSQSLSLSTVNNNTVVN